MWQPTEGFDPMRDLEQLKGFAISADKHLSNLLKNEKEIVSAINSITETQKLIQDKIALIDKVLVQIAKEKQ
jgi:hypothetical protein